MSQGITQEKVQEIIADYWEQIGFFAFDEFRQHGRGAVRIKALKSNDQPERGDYLLSYVAYNPETGNFEPEIAEMIRSYDPKWEIIIQYLSREGDVRTNRLRTPEGERHPWRIWFFENQPVLVEEFEADAIEG